MNTFEKTLFSFLLLFFSIPFIAQETGLAGYYADEFENRKTANGELYKMDEFTAAHKSHPYNTYLKITRIDNGKSVVVRVNDRGPYIRGRVVDVSKKAALSLGLIEVGLAEVRVEITSIEEAKKFTSRPRVSKPIVEEVLTARSVEPVKELTLIKKAKEKNIPNTLVGGSNYQEYDLYKIQLLRPEKEGYGVQVASLQQYENVLKQVANLQENHFKNILISVEKGNEDKSIYKLILGPFPDIPTANSYKQSLESFHNLDGFLVNLSNMKYE